MHIVRDIIHQSVSEVIEEFKWSRPVLKYSKDFAYFKTNKNDVTSSLFLRREQTKLPIKNSLPKVFGGIWII